MLAECAVALRVRLADRVGQCGAVLADLLDPVAAAVDESGERGGMSGVRRSSSASTWASSMAMHPY